MFYSSPCPSSPEMMNEFPSAQEALWPWGETSSARPPESFDFLDVVSHRRKQADERTNLDCLDLLTGIPRHAPGLLSPTAPEFVPMAAQTAVVPPTSEVKAKKVPFGERTNLVELPEGAKLFKDWTRQVNVSPVISEHKFECQSERSSAVSTCHVPSSTTASSSASSPTVAVFQNENENLPSMGSAGHAEGECRRCNFYPKGRCLNGVNCSFCHLPHDKQKLSRQEKRERRVAAEMARAVNERAAAAAPEQPLNEPARPPPGLMPPSMLDDSAFQVLSSLRRSCTPLWGCCHPALWSSRLHAPRCPLASCCHRPSMRPAPVRFPWRRSPAAQQRRHPRPRPWSFQAFLVS